MTPRVVARVRSLDGLRGLALVLVLAAHLDALFFMRAGYLGLDIFFVLSGYLITRRLLQLMIAPRPLRAFWTRRAARLMPALIFSALLLLPTWAWTPTSGALHDLPRDFALTISSSMDIFVRALPDEAFMPPPHGHAVTLGHFWSLCLEEKFYLVWPLFLAVTRTRARARRNFLILVVMLGIPTLFIEIAGEPLHQGQPLLTRAFFAHEARLWEIALGCLLGLERASSQRCAGSASPRWARWGSGSLAAAAALIGATSVDRLPLFALAPTLMAFATGLFIWVVANWDGESIFAHPRLARLGRDSYAIYVLHFPLMALSGSLLPVPSLALRLSIGILVAVVLGTAFTRLIEEPIERWAVQRAS